jgi:hypothetical protein
MEVAVIHPETQKVLDYPDTKGKRVALLYYDWQRLDKTEEVIAAPNLLRLAKLIDTTN